VLFLNEVLSLANWIGIICTVIGVVFIERSLRKPNIEVKKIGKGLIFPIIAALTLALSLTVKKYGLTIYDQPLLSSSIGYFTAFPFYAIALLFSSSSRGSFSFFKDFRLFWKAGVFMAFGVGLISFALSFERLSIVAPLLQVEPLFILFFSFVILRELESVSSKLVMSTVLIVFGAILVSIN
jgi:uncharacterized membrane protein